MLSFIQSSSVSKERERDHPPPRAFSHVQPSPPTPSASHLFTPHTRTPTPGGAAQHRSLAPLGGAGLAPALNGTGGRVAGQGGMAQVADFGWVGLVDMHFSASKRQIGLACVFGIQAV